MSPQYDPVLLPSTRRQITIEKIQGKFKNHESSKTNKTRIRPIVNGREIGEAKKKEKI